MDIISSKKKSACHLGIKIILGITINCTENQTVKIEVLLNITQCFAKQCAIYFFKHIWYNILAVSEPLTIQNRMLFSYICCQRDWKRNSLKGSVNFSYLAK